MALSGHIGTTPDLILLAFLRQLQGSMEADRESIFLTAQENGTDYEPPSAAPGLFIYTLTPGPIQFDGTIIDGGGNSTLASKIPIVVTVWSTVQLDETGRDTVALTDAQHGIVPRLTQVLGALSQFYPDDGTGAALIKEPALLEGPLTWRRPSRELLGMAVVFSAEFDWLITSTNNV